MGEVPIGVLLSGGIDSSAISYFIHKNNANLTTFNIGYPEVNEFQYSREVAKKFNLKHIEVVTTIDELIQNFDNVISALDEPIADPACFPLYILCNELKKHVTVVLSGEGGDELFTGYPQYVTVNNTATPDPFQFFLEKSYYFLNYKDFFTDPDIHAIHRHEHYFDMPSNLLNAMSSYDMKTWVPENLMMKADKILMAHSLEGRFPFLDDRVINFANKLPSNLKLNGNITKYILKNAMKRYLPDTIINRSKMGFTVPVTEILEKMKSIVMETFNNTNIFNDILNIDTIKNVPINYYNNKPGRYSGLQVWSIFIFLQWMNKSK
jgi:asparagine synthase (glutamine-hydrolysing)